MSVVRARTPNYKFNLVDYDAVGWSAPMDENFYILDSLIRHFVNITGVIGTWKNATAYNVADTVVDPDNGSLWRALVAHTSASTGAFAQDRAANIGYWTPNIGIAGSSDAVATPQQFGAITDEGEISDHTTAIQAAADEAATKGIPLQFDFMFRATSPIIIDLDQHPSIQIRGNGGVYVDADYDGAAAIEIRCTPEQIIDVTLIDNTATHTFGGATEASICCAITAPGHSISAGRVCKLISNDGIVDGDGSDFKGEVIYIGDVDGDILYATSRLSDTYTTSPRIALYRSGRRVLVEGITVATNRLSMEADGWRNAGLRISGVIGPVINNFIAKDASLNGLQLCGCAGAVVGGFRGASGYNAITSASITGYGIQDDNSEFTAVTGPTGYDMRSIYTTVTNATDVSDPWTYGPTRFSVVTNGVAHDCSSSPWNLHDGSEQCAFYNLTTINLYKGQSFAHAGIQVRGRNHIVEGCRHAGPGIGVSFKPFLGGLTNGHTLKNFRYDGDDYGLRIVSDSEETQYVDMSEVSILTTYQYGAIRASNAVVSGHDVRVIQRSPVMGRPAFDLRGNVRLTLEDVDLDFTHTPTTGSGPHSYVAKYTNEVEPEKNYIFLRSARVRSLTNTWNLIKYNLGDTPTACDGVVVVDADIAPVDTDGINTLGASSDFRRWIRVDDGRTYNSGRRTITPSTTPFALAIDQSLAEDVIRELTLTVERTLDEIEAGAFIGQKLVIVNVAASVEDLTIEANPGDRIQMAVNLVLSPGHAATFYWNGTVWYLTSVSVTVTGDIVISDHGSLTGLADDDHTQYHTDARAATWLGTKNVADLADVPALGTAGQRPRVNSGATALEYGKVLEDLPGRDVAWIGPADHETDTASLNAASFTVYAQDDSDVLDVAIRVATGASKAVGLELINHLLNAVVRFGQETAGKPEIKVYNETGEDVKHYINSDFVVLGGDASDRVGSAKLTVIGDASVSGDILGADIVGDYTEPVLIGVIRLWDDGAGKLRAKSGSDPANATDGTVLW